VNPDAGQNTLAVNWTNSAQVKFCAVSFTNVKQTGSFIAATPTTGTSATSSITIASATTRYCVMATTDTNGVVNINSVDATSLFADSSGAKSAGADYAPGTSSKTLTGTYSGSCTWLAVATDIVGG
jgi:hypothetical protein